MSDIVLPKGCALVPIEPTDAMLNAAIWALDKARERDGKLQDPRAYTAAGKYAIRYRAMIEVASNETAQLRHTLHAKLADHLHGTPCAQIRWQQEREELQAALSTAREDALRMAAGKAKVAWMVTPYGSIADVDAMCAMCEELSETILALIPQPMEKVKDGGGYTS
jgi:hypothetical protein